MPASPASSTTARSVQGRILEAADACFGRYGPDKTSMADVAAAARVSRGTVYRYFKDRDELVAAYVDWTGDRFLELVRERIDKLAGIEAQLTELAVLARSPQRALGAEFPVARFPAETLALLLTVHSDPLVRKSIDFLIPYIREAKKRKELRPNLDPREAAEWLAHVIFTVVDMPAVTFDADKPAELRRFVRRYVVRGLV
jgi:AcrR family transcriptional regulator